MTYASFNQKMANATSYLADLLRPNSVNPVEELTVDEITSIQSYLEQVKKRKSRLDVRPNKPYHNPYEYSSRQNQLDPTTYMGHAEFRDGIRDINVESSLVQRELTHGSGRKGVSGLETNRFENLLFDPQDTSHIIWHDSMPRGGYSTRADRLESANRSNI